MSSTKPTNRRHPAPNNPTITFPRLFEQQVRRTPERTAVSLAASGQPNLSYSYQQLNERANRLAHYLRSAGVRRGVFAGVYLERSPEMLAALLAVLKAGGAYAPLDPIYPEGRINYILEDAAVNVVLTQSTLAGRLPGRTAETIRLDTDWPIIASQPPTNPGCPAAPQDLAYLIYTSGSTGRPKGVQIPHSALSNFLQSMQRAPGITAEDVLFAVTTLSFDIAGLELFLPLTCGAQVVIAGSEVVGDANLLQEHLAQSEATIMQATPAAWSLLVESGWQGDGRLKILCGGEALPRPLADDLLERGSAVWNLYGPTETTIWSSRRRVEAGRETVSLGRPIANTQLHILDEHMNPAPNGQPGELYIGGEGLSWGYHNRPGLTAEKFVPNPFTSRPGQRLYKTGDLVRAWPDGGLEFIGRVDHQVKIRGYRVELGEIEAALTNIPGLEKSIVVARREQSGEKRLVAYSAVNGDAGPDVRPNRSDIRRRLEETLPAYMIPAAFVFLDAFPLTPNNKIDRRALPAPGTARPDIETPYAAPKTELEQTLAAMWQETLALEKVGRHDNFFELGGDSLKGAFFISHLQETLDAYLYISALLEAPTIAELAAYLETHYPAELAAVGSAETAQKTAGTGTQITETAVSRMRQWLAETMPYAVQPVTAGPKTPAAVFILSPPRSGSTLLRVVLAGHPALFAPPELDLLTFPTLAARRDILSQGDNFRLEGTIRALMTIHNCDADEAQRMMAGFEAQGMTVRDFYGRLQAAIAPQILVDKSITYANHLETLRRAEAYFENPRYIHLLRHPYGMIHSFEEVRLDRIYFRGQTDFSVRQLGELVWLINHQNILDFLQNVPAGRQFRLQYEMLVQEPRETAEKLCRFLGLDFHPGMLKPYEERRQRMTDGLYNTAESRMIGDVKFHGYSGIEAKAAERWKDKLESDFLSPITWRLAETVGYERLGRGEIGAADAAELLSQIDDLSDEEVEALLLQMM